jgi:putative DNA primase/helicase
VGKIDFPKIARLALANARSVLNQYLPGGKYSGAEYEVLNPVRSDKALGSFKVNVNTGAWGDFATSDKGTDLISLVAYVRGIGQREAAKELADFLGHVESNPPSATAGKPAKKEWLPVVPVPATAPAPPKAHPTLKKPAKTWEYQDKDSCLVAIICRFETSDGKEIRPLTFCRCRETGKSEWRWQGIPDQRPLYNLPAIVAAPDRTILICEGEKAADAAAGLFPEHVVTTIMGGCKAVGKTEFAPLAGRHVVIWRDADQPGEEYQLLVAEKACTAGAASVKVFNLCCFEKEGALLPKGWDAADAVADGWTAEEAAYLLASDGFIVEAIPEPAAGAESAPETKGKRVPRIRRDEAAGIILGLAEQLPLYRDDTKTPWTFIKGEMVLLLSQDVEDWLTLQYIRQTGSVPTSEAMNGAKRVLFAMARQEGESIDLYNRVAWRDGAAWYDLGRGRAVRTTAEGFSVVPAVPLFKSWPHQQPHPEPLPLGNPWEFMRYCHIAEENRLLVLTTLITSFIPGIAHPLWHVQGPQGSGKSSFCRLVKRIVDPSAAELQIVQPERETDFFLLLYHNYLVALDNLSGLNGRTSDLLCGASTGTAVSQRAYYTNLDTILIRLKNIVLLNGIVPLVSRADLLDRTITIHLDRIPADGRREERLVMEEFDAAIPQILGGIFSTLSKAMAIYPTVRLETLPRLADFARWGYSVAEALGGYGAQFLADFGANATAQGEEMLGQSTLALALFAYMDERDTWETTVGQAYSVLLEAATPAKGDNSFPGKPQDMRRYLERLRVTLADAGITYQFGHRGREGVPITFTRSVSKQTGPVNVEGVSLDESEICV